MRPTNADAPLDAAQRARGRRLAISSHPFGMTFRVVFTAPLPTLALLALGASETLVGIQSALVYAALVLQLPTLWLVARVSKRRILMGAHGVAVLGALPLLGYAGFASLGGDGGVALAIACFAVAAAAISTSEAVWFPILRGYVEPERIGRFFGTIRSGWHLSLIVYFLGSQAWLARHPGDFAPLFAVGLACGVLRFALISRLPERSERTGERIRVREAFRLAGDPSMRRYLIGAGCAVGAKSATLPFVVVLLRREIGFSDAAIVSTAVATYAGGLASLYLWGRVVDRLGAKPVFVWTSLGMATLVFALVGVSGSGSGALLAVIGFFFGYAVLSAGFGVADTHVLFALTPEEAPSRAVVLANVCVGVVAGLAPALAGFVLETSLAASADRLQVYRFFFVAMAAIQAMAFLPLRGIRRRPQGEPSVAS